MKRINNLLISILSLLLLTGCYRIDNNTISVLPYRFVDKNEAVELYKSNDDYFDSLSEYDIQYRTQNKEGTIESLKEYGASQIRDFTDTEKDSIISAMEEIEEIIKENGYQLPKIDEIVFIKSTQNEEGGSVAYTHGSHIYMNNIIPLYLRTSKENHQKGLSILIHEIFHCITRNNPDFRKEMYSLIHFDTVENEIEIPENIKKISISNPDVEHHDAYATFTINGKKKEYYMLSISTKPFEKEGDSYINYYKTILVPLNKEADDKDYYFIEEAENYWKIFGENTKYIVDPEECMADNFGYALVYGLNGSMNYKNPEIIQGILDRLKGEHK